ncbi:MAG TPA: Gfo/Idh/MocA family oxidoreductase [Chloroflexota bacterium]|nr:Gfo/Idh/MocA family oxidoreductase [Chloroflexota bacterium]
MSLHSGDSVRWGVLGTARITRSSFLPALNEVSNGSIVAVAGRDRSRTEAYAEELNIRDVRVGYEALIDDDDIDAVYIPLPNSMHAEWTIAYLQAGKAVLCEKPLCASLREARRVLEVARQSSRPLWEAFVFPFHRQMRQLHQLLDAGRIGDLEEIHSEFHFRLSRSGDIRLSKDLAGGSLNDVGCYPVHLATQLFRQVPAAAVALAGQTKDGVDEQMQGVLEFSETRTLLLSCGLTRSGSTFTRIIGSTGEIRLTSPFHPRPGDSVEVRTGDGVEVEIVEEAEPTFTPAIRHIHDVLLNGAPPRHLAVSESWSTAAGLALLHSSAQSGRRETIENIS